MIKNLTISDARKEINNLAKKLSSQDVVAVTNRGKEVLAIIPWDTYDALTQTLDILTDKEQTQLLKQGIKDLKEGKIAEWDTISREADFA